MSGIAAPLRMINVDTDIIIPKQFLKTIKRAGLGIHAFNDIRYNEDGSEKTDFVLNKPAYRGASILITGENFGCGSSREHAPLAIKGCGISAVLAKSFAAIFFRNAINIGLPFLESNDVDKINEGDLIEIDLSSGTVKNLTQNQTYKTQEFPGFLQEIVEEGGLMNYIKKRARK